MQVLPPALLDLIDAFSALPGVGPRSAERYAYFALRSDKSISQKLSSTLNNLHNNIDYCQKTFAS